MSEMALKAGKSVKAEYATWEDFLSFFDQMPIAAQRQYVSYNLDSIERPPAQSQTANEAWEKGDLSYFEKAVDDMRAKYPDLYAVLNAQRNSEWVLRIKQLLSGEGTYFILVGINHTLGPDSIQRQLKRNGIAVSSIST